jgi:hypothetical protein
MEQPQNFRSQTYDMKQVTVWDTTGITCQRTKFSRPGYLASMICASVLYIMEEYFALVVRVASWDLRTAPLVAPSAGQITTRIKHSMHVIPVGLCRLRCHIPQCTDLSLHTNTSTASLFYSLFRIQSVIREFRSSYGYFKDAIISEAQFVLYQI